ncbi:MAG: hypothetical protein ABJN52_13125 [Litorimonas sp.]
MLFFSMPTFLQNVPIIFYTAIGLILLYWVAFFVQDRFFLSTSSEAPDPEFVRDSARVVVRLGKDNYREMLDNVADAASYCGLTFSEAEQILDEEIESLISDQEDWPKVTEVDSLNTVFSNLEILGYFTGGGMVDDPGHEVSKARRLEKLAKRKGQKTLGYIFYPRDYLEEVVLNGGSVDFWYGLTRRKTSQEEELRVMNDLNAALKEQGLTPEWDGTLKSHLTLPINWQVRWDENRAKSD